MSDNLGLFFQVSDGEGVVLNEIEGYCGSDGLRVDVELVG